QHAHRARYAESCCSEKRIARQFLLSFIGGLRTATDFASHRERRSTAVTELVSDFDMTRRRRLRFVWRRRSATTNDRPGTDGTSRSSLVLKDGSHFHDYRKAKL